MVGIPFLGQKEQKTEEETKLSDSELGEWLVRLARQAIHTYVKEKKILRVRNPPKLAKEKLGVFVTLESYPDKKLRGCIGYPRPIKELWQAIVECAINAAVGDPRFEPLKNEDMHNTVVEVSVLTSPQELKTENPEDRPKEIKVGRDGLMVEHEIYSGLLLPQVAVQWNWDEEEFLSHTCDKAGLPRDCWKKKEVAVSKFQARIFTETEPKGSVMERRTRSGKDEVKKQEEQKQEEQPPLQPAPKKDSLDDVSW